MSTDGSDLRGRLGQLFDVLQAKDGVSVSLAEINDSCSEDEIAKVHEKLGFQLGSRFLSYYRSANGARLEWDNGEIHGFLLLPLSEVFLPDIGCVFGHDSVDPGEMSAPFLGGMDEHALRKSLRCFEMSRLEGGESPEIALYADAENPEPLIIFPNDYNAALCDNHPMRATSFIEMLVNTCGERDVVGDFTGHGAEGEYEIIEWNRDDWATLGGPAAYLKWMDIRDEAREDPNRSGVEYYRLLKEGHGPGSLGPKRWIELRFDRTYPA